MCFVSPGLTSKLTESQESFPWNFISQGTYHFLSGISYLYAVTLSYKAVHSWRAEYTLTHICVFLLLLLGPDSASHTINDR